MISSVADLAKVNVQRAKRVTDVIYLPWFVCARIVGIGYALDVFGTTKVVMQAFIL